MTLIAATFGVFNITAFAEESHGYFTAEQYTDSDRLLNADGSLSDKRIQDFVKDVKALKNVSIIEDIAGVIPLEYLESDESGVFSYMGKEYGFYIQKFDWKFYMLLINFTFEEYGENTGQYRVRIEPILQQSFYRIKSAGENVWVKDNDERYDVYVANPSFMTEIANANSLNYGDAGYSMSNDDGLIIRQTRVNHGGLYEPTTATKLNAIADFATNIVIGAVESLLPQLAPELEVIAALSNIISYTDVIISLINDAQNVYEAFQKKYVEHNNEDWIGTRWTKDAQLTSGKPYFSRNMFIQPIQNILLSDDGSYAEAIVMLNDSNCRTSLLQACTFDIVSASNLYEPLPNPEGASKFGTYSLRYLYDDKSHVVMNSNLTSDSSVYLLPNGDQFIDFTPKYSGEYTFQVPLGTYLELDGTKNSSFILEGGKTKTFRLVNNLGTKIIGKLSCAVQSFSSSETYQLLKNSSKVLAYQHSTNDYVVLNANTNVGILDENWTEIVPANSNRAFVNFIKGKTYYIILKNNSSSTVNAKVTFSAPKSIALGQDTLITSDKKVASFTSANYMADYELAITNVSCYVDITDSAGKSLVTGNREKDNKRIYTFKLPANETCYFNFSQADGSNTATVSVLDTICEWKINGEIANSYRVRLKPNATYTITAEYSIDGKTFKVENIFLSSKASNVTFSNNSLYIPSLSNGTEIELTPNEIANHKLIIEVDDMKTKIRLDHNGGTSSTEYIDAELHQNIPSSTIKAPTKTGYRFLGYYYEISGTATMYITANMEGQVWDIDVDEATLHAHWERVQYTLTFDNRNGFINRRTIYYGDAFPEIQYAPKKDGYSFVGYFTEPNGGGEQYYAVTSEMVDDRQSAQIYGYDHYYVEGIEFCYSITRWQIEGDLTLYAHWKVLSGSYAIEEVIEGEGKINFKTVLLTHNVEIEITPRDFSGYEFKCFARDGKVEYDNPYKWTPKLTWDVTTGKVTSKESLIAIYTKKECIAEGTLITLADGRQVPVELLTGNESLLVWNLFTGQFDSAKILFIDKHETKLYNIINLEFSDGTSIKVIAEHAFWDCDLNKYVYLDKDASQYIGHWFSKQTTNTEGNYCNSKVQLVAVSIQEEYTTAYSPVTSNHLCYYVNGMLSMPGGINGLFNIFDVDAETMTIDEQAMERDIIMYGVYTYEEFAAQLPVSEEIFNAFNGQYLKVAMGKGLVDMETLQILVLRYQKYFN
ncbi:MAG: InlB B-repeat-containing protein [Clostridiales bacterium]|nr:InlB B-repeat-containing protein [Clostridiales bacterium]